MPLLYQPVINANIKAAHVDISLGGLVLTANLSNATRNFHRIETATTFSLDDAVTAAPCDRSRVRSFSNRISANDERAIGFDLFPACFHHEVVRDEAVKARAHESLIRRQGTLTFEQILATKLSDLATAPMDLLGVEAVQLGQLLLLLRHREVVGQPGPVARLDRPGQEDRQELALASLSAAPRFIDVVAELLGCRLQD